MNVCRQNFVGIISIFVYEVSATVEGNDSVACVLDSHRKGHCLRGIYAVGVLASLDLYGVHAKVEILVRGWETTRIEVDSASCKVLRDLAIVACLALASDLRRAPGPICSHVLHFHDISEVVRVGGRDLEVGHWTQS